MNYRRLEYFLAVVDAGTVTAAAQTLLVAQPALSRQLKILEQELRMQLFTLRGNRLVLTQAGLVFVPLARQLVMHTQSATDAVEALRNGRIPSLRVGATATTIRVVLAPFLATTTRADPLITVKELPHLAVYDSVLHKCDFVISPAPRLPGRAAVDLGSAPLRANVAPDHPWAVAGLRTISLEEVARERLILPSRANVTRYVLDVALAEARIELHHVSECDEGQSILALAAAGHGVGITTEPPAFGVYSLRITTQVSGTVDEMEPILLPVHVAWMKNHYAADTIYSIAVRIREFMVERLKQLTLPTNAAVIGTPVPSPDSSSTWSPAATPTASRTADEPRNP